MTFSIRRRQFLMGSSALLAAGALGRPAFAQSDALRLYWWGGQTRADRTLAVADLWAKAKGAPVPTGEFGSFADHWPKLATMVADLWRVPSVALVDSTAEVVDYHVPSILTGARTWVRGHADAEDGVRPFTLFVKRVHHWRHSPAFAFVPPGMGEWAAASVPWRSEPLLYASDLPERLPEVVRLDQSRFRQVLINLLSNAIKFTEQGAVTLKVGYSGQIATFEVRDTGPGIPPEERERIFERFERGSAAVSPGAGTTARTKPGAGLGLAIARTIVEILGGKLELESDVGAGSCFRITMMLGEVSPGGVGAGLYGMLVFALLAVFIAGLMVGRTPEYLGKKVQAAEMKLVVLYLLAVPALILSFAGISVVLDSATSSILNPGPHGLSEVVYAFTSASMSWPITLAFTL